MAEYVLGRIKFVYQGAWNTGTAYVVDDVVTVGGKTFICIQKHTASATFAADTSARWRIVADGLGWRGNWSPSSLYNTGDLVQYGAIVYQCNTAHTSSTVNLGLENDSANWDIFAEGTRWLGDWATEVFYHVGDLVKYGGYVYYCATGHISAATVTLGLEVNSGNWQTFNAGLTYLGNWTADTRYKQNDLVKSDADTFICVQPHTSGSAIDSTNTLFQPFVEGLQFESSWNNSTVYQGGDLVTYGGYTYVALLDNTDSVPSSNPNDWDPFTTGFFFAGDWNNSTYYKINSVVRLNGYTYLSTVDSPSYVETATATQAGLSVTITDTTAATDVITVATTVGLTAGARLTVAGNVGNLITSDEYFIIGTPTATQFQVANSPGGSAVQLATTTGQSVVATVEAYVTIGSTADLVAGQSITFASTFGGITGSATFYVLGSFTSTQLRISLTPNGVSLPLTTTVAQTISCNIAVQPGNTAYWARLNPGLYWTNTAQTYTNVTTTAVVVDNVAATGVEYTVVRNNGVYTLTRTDNGSDYTTGDIVKIAGTAVGGITPANDITITITASAGAVVSEIHAGTSVTWTDTVNYVLGDVVTFGVNSYNCINPHTSTTSTRPDNDTSAIYWNILTTGAEEAALQLPGDTLYYGQTGPTRLPIGLPGQILRSDNGYPTWTTYGQITNIVYVGPNGVDEPAPSYGQTIDLPWKTVQYAAKQVEDGYLRASAQHLLKTNKQFIIKETTNYVVFTFATTVTATNSSNDITAVNTGNFTVGMPIQFTGTTFGNVVAGTIYYIKTIADSTTFTISASIDGTFFNPGNGTGSMTAILAYNNETFERDVGIIVDGLVHDLGHAGNLKSTTVALSYYASTGNAYISSELQDDSYTVVNISNQVTQIVAAYNYLKLLVADVLNNASPTYNYQLLNGLSTRAFQQVAVDYIAEDDAVTTSTALLNIITSGLLAQTNAAILPAINPSTTIFVKTGTYTEVLPIVVNEYTAVVGDELRGATIQPSPANPLLVNDTAKSVNSLTRLRGLMNDLVTNVIVSPTSGNTVAQVITLPDGSVGLTTASAEIVALSTTLYDIIDSSVNTGQYTFGTFANYNTSLSNVSYACIGNLTGETIGYGDGIAQITQNIAMLTDELSEWLAANEPGVWNLLSSAQQADFQQRVTYVLDAVIYDMYYGGNTQTLEVADSYYSYFQAIIIGNEKTATIAAYVRLKDIIDNIVIANVADWLKTTATAQVTTGTAGSAAAATFAQERMQNIIDYLTNDSSPATVEVAVTAASVDRQDAFDAVQSRRSELQKDATAWIKKYFQYLDFTESAVFSDIGHIVDAISRDVLTQSNFATSQAGVRYHKPLAVLTNITKLQKTAKLGVVNFLMYKLKSVAASGAVAVSQTLLDDAINTVSAAQTIPGQDVQTVGTVLYNNVLGIINGSEIIRANKEFLVAEARAWISASYGGSVITTTASTDVFTTSAAHNLVAGDPVRFSGSLIAGSNVADNTIYYVLADALTSTDFKITTLQGNTVAVNIVSDGTGTMAVDYAYNVEIYNRNISNYIEALVYGMQYTGNYKLRRETELYLNSVEGSQLSNMFLVRNGTGLRNMTLAGSAGQLGLPITNLTATGSSVTLSFVRLGSRVPPYWAGQTITVSGMDPAGYNGTYVVTASTTTSVTFASTVTASVVTNGIISNQYGTKRPTAGAYSSLDEGFGPWDSNTWVTTRSCYAQNLTLFGTGNVGMKIDSSLHAGGNKSIVANDYTTLCSDGIGVWCTGSDALTELVSVFCYYSYAGYLAELGGKMRATNGNSSYGTYGVLSEGVDTYETPITAQLNNTNAQVQIESTITDGTNQILRFEFANAGSNYSNISYAINGSGFNAAAIGDEFRDNAVFETRILDNNDGSGVGQIGGLGFLTVNNTASGGNLTEISLAGSDIALTTTYLGMQLQVTAGTGVGQFGTVINFNSGTKLAKIAKSSFATLTATATTEGANNLITVASTASLYVDMPVYFGATFGGLTAYTLYYVIAANFSATQFAVSVAPGGSAVTTTASSGQTVPLYAAGWDHIVAGTEIAALLDATSAYTIEPKITYTAPGYTANSTTLSGISSAWSGITYGGSRYLAIASGSTVSSYSADGKTWSNGGTLTGTTTAWTDLAFGGGYGSQATMIVGGLGGSLAVLSATITAGGLIESIQVIQGGFGYNTPPTIEIVGNGAGAVAVASVLNGSISRVDVLVQGSGYNVVPTVNIRTDVTTEFVVSSWGNGYTQEPIVTITAPFTGTVFANSTAYNTLGVYVSYENEDDVTNWYQVTGTGTSAAADGPIHTSGSTTSGTVTLLYVGTTAKGTPILNNLGVSNITLSTVGRGYTFNPTVTITDPNAKYVAISSTSADTAYQTPNGTTTASAWTAGGTLPATTWGGITFGIITGTPIWLAVGGSENAATTNDGVTWTTIAAPTLGTGTYTSVAYGNGRFIAVENGGAGTSIFTGGAWANGGSLPGSANWSSVAYGNGRFIAVASGSNLAAYSIDNGVTWASSGTGLPASTTWSNIAYGQGLFLAVADTGSIAATSSDGINWTEQQLPSSDNWVDIAFGNTDAQPLWVVVKNTGLEAATVKTGATSTARVSVSSGGDGSILQIRMTEPGSGYPTGTVTATTTSSDVITVDNTENLIDSQPIEFTSGDEYGLTTDITYYVIGSTIVANTSFKVSATPGSATPVTLTSATGLIGTYRAGPIITIVDSSRTKDAITRVRMGDGAVGNPSFSNRGVNNATASSDGTGDGFANLYQPSTFINIRGLSAQPIAGSNVEFASIPGVYFKLVQVLNVLPDSGENRGLFTATFQINPGLSTLNAPANNDLITTRLKYSQVRLTGHDFLYIGTGGAAQTNYPFVDVSTAYQDQQTLATNGGRNFFTSTDQDGNFNVGNLFSVQQATGTATLNATAFNLSGLQSLQLGSVTVGTGSATITQFSADPFFTANSDNIVPTQRAIKSYITSQIGGGQSSLNVNTLTSGLIFVANNTITTTTGVGINVNAKLNFTGGIDGAPVALQFFLLR